MLALTLEEEGEIVLEKHWTTAASAYNELDRHLHRENALSSSLSLSPTISGDLITLSKSYSNIRYIALVSCIIYSNF
jgi:hypothetical protein